jgi:hypothetical protein
MRPGVVAFMLIFATDTANLLTFISHLTVSVHLGLSSWNGTSGAAKSKIRILVPFCCLDFTQSFQHH